MHFSENAHRNVKFEDEGMKLDNHDAAAPAARIRRILSSPIQPAMHDMLAGLMMDQRCRHRVGWSARAQHYSTYERMLGLAGKLPRGAGDLSDPSLLLGVAEWAAVNDPSVCFLFLIQYALCIGTLVELGKDNVYARKYALELAQGTKAGAYMITEIGNSNSQIAVRVEARYDAQAREFVLHTPDDGALKFTNVGINNLDKIGIVCARLFVDEKDCGVFAFVLDISDRHGPRPGVRLSSPAEIAYLPLDYGFAGFDNVRVPFEAWLSDGATIDAAGRFHDPLDSANARMVRSLIAPDNIWAMSGSALCAVARASAAQTLSYSMRRSSAARIAAEVPLLSYYSQRRAVFRALATSYVTTCFAKDAARQWGDTLHRRAAPKDEETQHIVWAPWSATNKRLSLVKALTTWATEEVIAECRLHCGVAGQLTVNRYIEYEGLAHAFNDAGGNNFLILLDMARTLVSTPLPDAPPVPVDVPLPENAASAFNRLRTREYRLTRQLTEDVAARTAEGFDLLDIWNPLLPIARDAAQAHGLCMAMQTAISMAETVDDVEGRTILRDLSALFILDQTDRHAAWLMSEALLSDQEYRSIGVSIDRLCERLVRYADTLVAAFGYPHAVIQSPVSDPDADYVTSLLRAVN
ncbi:acyl-CoA dehydrogenase family protein [Burkholderia singularis]|uniref:Putative acyl-CoA oxidase n=1 Tax=Burkholderia singularis TaxID=1503053 RepID=A0A238GZH5_9BURK|nr:acyl-CoA dehydrogenase [Burkholderia singularis]SMF98387.1 putative acyl-CoA oxidase [Burkholderia singularis]